MATLFVNTSSTFTALLDLVSSKYAFIAYVAIIAVIIIILIISLIANSNKPANFIIDQAENSVGGAVNVASSAEVSDEETKDEEEKLNETIRRFCLLPEIDERAESYKRDDYVETLTLAELCDEFREFAAYKLKLYYDISDIRRFIAGLAVTKIIILQGMSGTGKTSLAYAFGQFLDNPSTVIPVQPMWKERTDLLGYYNEFTKRFNETDLLVKMYEALYSKDIYITVLDEMNIARVEYYFAEFLSLL